MENKTEIGKVIKNKLDNLDKSPSDFVWSKIEKDLNNKRRKRILFWLIPSILTVIILSSLLYINSDFHKENIDPKTPSQKNASNSTNSKNETLPANLQKKGSDEITTVKKTKTVKLVKQSTKFVTSTNEYEEYEVVKKYKVIIKKEQITSKPIKTTAKDPNTINAKKPIVAYKKGNSKNGIAKKIAKSSFTKPKKTQKKEINKISKTTIVGNKTPKNVILEKTIAEKDTITYNNFKKDLPTSIIIAEPKMDSVAKKDSTDLKKKTTPKREYKERKYTPQTAEIEPEFTISVFYGPALFGSLNSKSMISPRMDDLSKSHPITSHYGVYVKTMFDKIGFRGGFSKINLKTSTRLNQNLIPDYTNINLKTEINVKETFGESNQVDLVQNLSYYELPLEFNYAIKKDESKIGIEAFTGFSFLILDKNKLYLKSENVSQQNIGEAKNLSGANFSYNLGLGLSYKLTERIALDINPLFKYYLSTFNKNEEAKPYSISLQSGVSYKF
ncbi:PorT family protein [Flavobacterium tyrosinilyticum]|uniref:PorT family protein n=1 Tax=Flavobacterium tyrosinilyticum TaxID=1658740 RepID=UPI002030F256|nr:PorT family protein [Flavobacterium tyrosinilyticum]MCM0665023.1 PorT family protein [Flavobacterium tyrosinilyticum]